jgi:hypothetical protein
MTAQPRIDVAKEALRKVVGRNVNVSQHVPSNKTVRARIDGSNGGGGGGMGNNGGNNKGNNSNGNKSKSLWWNILLDMLVTMYLAESCAKDWQEEAALKIFADTIVRISSKGYVSPVDAALILLRQLSERFKELEQAINLLTRTRGHDYLGDIYSIVAKPEFKQIISSCPNLSNVK